MLLIASSAIGGKPPVDAVEVGTETCLQCHEVGQEFEKTAHGKAYWAKAEDRHINCESCHGPGSAHVEEQDPALIINPGDLTDPDNSATCVACHGGMSDEATFGQAHYAAANGCADCHTSHNTESSLHKPVETLCVDCHTEQWAQASLPSHHPIREGRMTCVDCHDPHGQQAKLAFAGDERERCFRCHAQYQGPFVFEHAPVNEDCGICHDPHGTVADNLLVQNDPMLCLSCHSMHFHTQITGLDGDFTAPLASDRGGTSTLDAFKSAMTTKCTQCHSAVHGTDLKSQSITQPDALSR